MTERHVHFVQSLEPLQGGGLGAAARQLHAAMREKGLASRLFATRAKSFRQEWPEVIQCERRSLGKFFYAPSLARAAAAVLNDPAIIHGHGFYVHTNWVFGRMARRRGLPLVYHPHGFFEPWILARSRGRKRLVHWLFEDANFRHARLWRALTATEADQIRKTVGRAARIVVAPNGIDLAPIKRAGGARHGERKRALFLGRLHPKKGLDLLVRAWSGMGEAARDWELIIAGPDEGGHQVQVRQWVAEAGLMDRVTFTGPVSGEAKFDLLASADLFLLTSYSEGLPMAPLEAMGSAVSVAITHECNLPAVSEAEAGWVCRADAGEVAAMLRAALTASDDERRQRGESGRRLVEARFTWQKTVATLEEACQQLT